MKDKVKIYNAFSVIITTDKEQEELTNAYLDSDWTEIGRIIYENVKLDVTNSSASGMHLMRQYFGARGSAKTQMMGKQKHGDDND